jgi:HK97 family phage major capsid protein
MNLHQIRETRAAKVAEMRTLVTKAETEKRALAQPEQAAFDKLKAEVTDLDAQEARAQFLEDAERRAVGSPVDKSMGDLVRQVSVLEVMRAQVEGRALSGAAAEYNQETERRTGRKAQGMFVPMSAIEQRVNTTSTAGQLVPTDHRPDQYIGPMRDALLARRLGVRVLSGLSGNVSIPKYTSGMTTGWVAENSALSATDMDFESVTLAPKHAGGIGEMSRQLLMQSSPDIEQLVRDDLAALIAKAIDSALIKGGGSNEPSGVLEAAGIQTQSLATLSWANILTMIQKLDLVNMSAANFLGSMQVKAKLAGTLKAAGIAGYIMEGGRIDNIPAYFTNQVPLNATPTPDTGQLILGDWSQVLLGVWSEVDILVNPYAETAYSKGNVLVRAMSTVDIALRHENAFVVADDVTI